MEEILKYLGKNRDMVLIGLSDALPFLNELKKIADYCESLQSEIKPLAFREAEEYGPGTHKHDQGFYFFIADRGTRYKYEENPDWQEAKNELTRLETLLKTGGVDYETGENFEPVTKQSTKSIILR